MNLAEIRKKAQQARQEAQEQASRPAVSPIVSIANSVVPPPPVPVPDVPPAAVWPGEQEDSVYEPAVEVSLAAEVIDDFSAIELASAADEETAPSVILTNINNTASATLTPQSPVHLAPPTPTAVEPVPAASVAEPVVAPTPLSGLRGFDPLAILLAGRENARIVESEDLAVEADVAVVMDENVEEYLCFRVASEQYAINIMAIKEIVKPREVTEVPRMPNFVTGIISLRGVIIPIIDMRLRLALPIGTPSGKERVVVIKNEEGVCGVLVDEVIQVVRLHVSAIEQPPAVLEGIDRDFVKGIGRFGERMLILLNLENILDLTLC